MEIGHGAVAPRLNERFCKSALMSGAQFAWQHIDESQKQPKAKCHFISPREMSEFFEVPAAPAKPVHGVLF